MGVVLGPDHGGCSSSNSRKRVRNTESARRQLRRCRPASPPAAPTGFQQTANRSRHPIPARLPALASASRPHRSSTRAQNNMIASSTSLQQSTEQVVSKRCSCEGIQLAGRPTGQPTRVCEAVNVPVIAYRVVLQCYSGRRVCSAISGSRVGGAPAGCGHRLQRLREGTRQEHSSNAFPPHPSCQPPPPSLERNPMMMA